MIIHHCDICGMKLDKDYTVVSVGLLSERAEMCATCAKPVTKFLEKNGLLKDKLKSMRSDKAL